MIATPMHDMVKHYFQLRSPHLESGSITLRLDRRSDVIEGCCSQQSSLFGSVAWPVDWTEQLVRY
jgi:hypothetical protein